MFQVNGEVASLTLVVPSLHPSTGAERAIRKIELCTLPHVSLELGTHGVMISQVFHHDCPPSFDIIAQALGGGELFTCLQGLKSSPLARMHLW